MRTVFKLQQPPKKFEAARDYRSLQNFGAIVTILPPDLNPSVFPCEARACLRQALEEAKEGDYILWSGGDPMTALVAGQVLVELGKRNLRWLRWDKKVKDGERSKILGEYTAIPIPL